MKISAHFLVFTVDFCLPGGLRFLVAQFSQPNGKDTKFLSFFSSGPFFRPKCPVICFRSTRSPLARVGLILTTLGSRPCRCSSRPHGAPPHLQYAWSAAASPVRAQGRGRRCSFRPCAAPSLLRLCTEGGAQSEEKRRSCLARGCAAPRLPILGFAPPVAKRASLAESSHSQDRVLEFAWRPWSPLLTSLLEFVATTAFGVCCHRRPWSSPRHLEHA